MISREIRLVLLIVLLCSFAALLITSGYTRSIVFAESPLAITILLIVVSVFAMESLRRLEKSADSKETIPKKVSGPFNARLALISIVFMIVPFAEHWFPPSLREYLTSFLRK